jgi:GNAT superfamily N-acetyltransferase
VYDIEERQEASPWVVGTIVRRELRGHGIGQALMVRLESWAATNGFPEAWIATEQAEAFYRRCGWHRIEEFVTRHGDVAVVLHKTLHKTLHKVLTA